jgi:hypothetical protein
VNATAGFTYEKLLEILQNFMDNDVGNDMPETFVQGITGDEHTDLMSETELVSGEYVRSFSIEKGRMVEAAGIKLIPFAANARNPILDVNSGTRDCPCMSGRAMCVGLSKDPEVEIEKRSDKVETYQVVIVFELGAARTEGKLIQKVQTTD